MFVADDHELVRYALRTVLEAEADIEVVGEAAECEAAISGCVASCPDVLVLDMRMPGGGGVDVCRAVRETCPQTAVLMLTSFDEDEELFGVLSAGASGYLLKDTRPERIVHAIRAVADGEAVFDNGRAARIVSRSRQTGTNELEEPLSEREMDVLQLMAKGHVEQGDRQGALDRRDDRQDPREPHPPQAGPGRPHPGGAPGREVGFHQARRSVGHVRHSVARFADSPSVAVSPARLG